MTDSGLSIGEASFQALYGAHARDVHRFALFLSGDAALADDIVSETFVRLWHARARVEETPPLGGLDQPAYLNQMVLVETALPPHDLLRALQAIEMANGRERRAQWGSRTLDLDIVRYDGLVLTTTDLTLPHPGVATRDFWQRELAELAPHDG